MVVLYPVGIEGQIQEDNIEPSYLFSRVIMMMEQRKEKK